MPSATSASVTALGACIVMWAASAHAYCPEVTKAPPANYDPARQGCFDTDPEGGVPLPPLFWRNKCVGYSLQRNASRQVSLADATRVAAQAFGAWSSASCASGPPSIAAMALEPVGCNESPSQEHNNVIIFRDDGWPYQDSANTLGYTKLTINTVTGEIYGADIEINTSDYKLVASGAAPPGGYDLATVLTHEAGHFLGLAHSAESKAIMFASYHAGAAALSLDDIAGICSIYSPDGTRNTIGGLIAPASCCDPSPRLGFLTQCGSRDAGVSTVCGLPTDDGGGAVGDDGGGSDGGMACASNAPSCSIGHAGPGQPAGGVAVCGVIIFGAMAGRTLRRARVVGAALGLSLALLGASSLVTRDVQASVSVGVLFEELVQRASAVAVVTPVEDKTLWEDGSIVTYTRVHVDRLMAGHLDEDVWVRTLGGAVGVIAQMIEGEATFTREQASLVFVRAQVDPRTGAPVGSFGVVERAQGQYPVVSIQGQKPRLAPTRDIGVVLPPPRAHWTRAAERLPPGVAARLARDVLDGRALDDVAREVAAKWVPMHS